MGLPSLDIIWSLTWYLILAPLILFPIWYLADRAFGPIPLLASGPQAIRRIAVMRGTARDVAYLFSVDLAVAALLAIAVQQRDPSQVGMAAGIACVFSWAVATLVPIPSLVAITTLVLIVGGIIAPAAVWSAPADGADPAASPAAVAAPAATNSPQPVANQGNSPAQAAPLKPATGLHTGGRALVTATLNLRSSPNGPLVGTLSPGTPVTVVDGPVSSGGYVWWRVDSGKQVAWCAQGDGSGAQWLQASN